MAYGPYGWGVPGALGARGDYYTGGGAFGSQGRERLPREDRRPHQGRDFWDKAGDEVASWMGDDEAARRRASDHRGRGPRGYTRSDERISEDVHDRLTEDWQLDASEIEVRVAQGEVTLDGSVDSRADKRRAEDVVDAVSGVGHVQNNLRVRQARSQADTGGT